MGDDKCPHCGKSKDAIDPGLSTIEWVMLAGVAGILAYITWPIIIEFICG